MKFEKVDESFGSKSSPYTNDPATDVECILGRIKEFDSRGPKRHVVFVGEGHDNKYDTGRRAKLIDEIRSHGKEHFQDAVPKVVAERFRDVPSGHVHLKEPDLADDLPKAFTALRKPTNQSTGEFSESEKQLNMSGPASQSRNQWFAFAIMKTIAESWDKAVPIIVACGDDHEPFVSAALSDLAKNGYGSEAEIVWHHFPSAPAAVQPMNQVQVQFEFDLQGMIPVGFIRGNSTDEKLIQLAKGHLQKDFTVHLAPAYVIEDDGWALFFKDKPYADTVRQKVISSAPYLVGLKPNNPVRVVRLNSPKDIQSDWSDAFY